MSGDPQIHSQSSSVSQAPLPLQAGRVAASGKAIIIGEHAVVYGAAAIAMPLPAMTLEVEFRPQPMRDELVLKLGGRPVSDPIHAVFREACELLDRPLPAMSASASSKILIGAGLGSSASICVVALRMLAHAYGLELSRAELANLANQLERRFHGNPSGLDTAAVAFEQTIRFSKGQPITPIHLQALPVDDSPARSHDGGWPFVLLDSGLRSSTKSMIERARPYFRGENGQRRLYRFDALANLVHDGLSQADTAPVAAAMNEAGRMLQEAGVSNETMLNVMAAARKAGAIAVKPTGAGGGGCLLALLNPEDQSGQLTRLRSYLNPESIHEVTLR